MNDRAEQRFRQLEIKVGSLSTVLHCTYYQMTGAVPMHASMNTRRP